jgi:hypothetical protein
MISFIVGAAVGALVPQVILWATIDWADRRGIHPINHIVASHLVGIPLAVLLIAAWFCVAA